MARTSETTFSHHPKFDKKRQSSCLKMSGKLIFLILILFSKSVISSSPSTLIGGLVYYEEHSNGPIYLNPHFYTVTREVDTSPLEGFIQYAHGLCRLYETQCQKTDSSFSNKEIEYKKALEANQPQTILHIHNTTCWMLNQYADDWVSFYPKSEQSLTKSLLDEQL
jgi:hypothetical protein